MKIKRQAQQYNNLYEMVVSMYPNYHFVEKNIVYFCLFLLKMFHLDANMLAI